LDAVNKDLGETEFGNEQSKIFPKKWLDALISGRPDALVYQWIVSTKIYPQLDLVKIHPATNRITATPLFTTILYWEDIGKSIEHNSGVINIEVKRRGETLVVPLTPKNIVDKNIFGDEVKRKIIGIKPLGTQTVVYLNPIEAIEYATNQTKNATLLITKGVEKLITGAVPSDQVGGVVSIVDITSKASSDGFVTLLFFAALISVNLGVLNLLPIPALDGGHIVFNLYEMITKKAPSDAVLYKLTLVGWGLLIGLMFLGLYNDINRLLG
jgi:regulator of sigma E protease